MTPESEWLAALTTNIAAAHGVTLKHLAGAEWEYTIQDDDQVQPTSVEIALEGRILQLGPEVVPPIAEMWQALPPTMPNLLPSFVARSF